MQVIRFFCLLFSLGFSIGLRAQGPNVIQEYIDTYREIAIEEMQRTGVPAAIKLAQGIHETTAGTSELVRKSNNHFGIKCKSNWTGESVKHTDDAPHECFRKYEDPFQSYRDHSDFLKNSARYASLFKLDPLDYTGWANGLKKAGYATNPRYPQIIIKLIETWKLQDYTLIAMGKKEADEEITGIAAASQSKETIVNPVAITASVKNYPAHEFRINNTRVIYVTAGTSCLSLARQYNLPLARLFEFNEMEETENFTKDQLVYLQRKRKTGENVVHIVKSGETIWDIAQEEGIRMESLLEYNRLESYMQPAAGEQLYLRTKAPVAPKLVKHSVGRFNEAP
jgi:LysM repeat protein